jgi:hypothetical protein
MKIINFIIFYSYYKILYIMIPYSNVNMINNASTPLIKFKGVSKLPSDVLTSFSWHNSTDVNKYKTVHPSFRISTPIRQGNCGDCWTIATAQVFADRWAIESKQLTPIFSHSLLLSCSIIPPSCGGGNICEAINYIATKGILKSNECWNYNWCSKVQNCYDVNLPNINREEITRSIPNCELYEDKCFAFNEDTKKLETKSESLLSKRYKCKDWNDIDVVDSYMSCKTFKLQDNDTRENVINKIKEEIFLRGPVVSSFRLIPDHFKNNNNWINKIYTYTDKDDYCYKDFESTIFVGGHAVSIVGWGKDSNSGLDYWIIRSTWGEINDLNHKNGYFKMAISNCEKKINVSMGLDVPINVIERYGTEERDVRYTTFGGVYAMLPNVEREDYNNSIVKISEGDKMNQDRYNKGNNKLWILFIGGIMILFIIVYVIISKSKK